MFVRNHSIHGPMFSINDGYTWQTLSESRFSYLRGLHRAILSLSHYGRFAVAHLSFDAYTGDCTMRLVGIDNVRVFKNTEEMIDILA